MCVCVPVRVPTNGSPHRPACARPRRRPPHALPWPVSLVSAPRATALEYAMKIPPSILLAAAIPLTAVATWAATLTTAFTFGGRLTDGAGPASGSHDLRFRLFSAAAGDSPIGMDLTKEDVQVVNGIFSVQLDFGTGAVAGEIRWLETSVRPGGSVGSFTILSPRQELTTSPYALHASTAGLASSAEQAWTADHATTADYAPKAGAVAWANITGIPPGFADGGDSDTRYGAGPGLGLSMTNFFITPGGVIQSMLAPEAVTATEIAPGQVVKSLNSLKDDVTLTAGPNIALNPAGNGIEVAATNLWTTTGNDGLDATHFLGTRDAQPLELRVGNARALLLQPTDGTPNVIAGSSGNRIVALKYRLFSDRSSRK